MGEVVYREKYRLDGRDVVYVKHEGNKYLSHLKLNEYSVHKSLLEKIRLFFQEVFLPQGYPESVSDDYWEYQFWDSIQAFCSTLSGTLTTQAILKGVGVGDTSTTPLSAAITWILKDGTGMVGRILFAWKKGTSLDADCKKWRLFADFLNDMAMCIEMFLLPMVPCLSTTILCLSTTMKAIVGVAGGATKAATIQHQAIHNNMGDVSAKDGSQETCLNLIGSIFGILLLSYVSENETSGSQIFILCILIHMYSNYRAVKSLNFKTLNKERLLLILKNYLTDNSIPDSNLVNQWESVFLGDDITDEEFCGFNIKIGCSINGLINDKLLTDEELKFYAQYSDQNNRSYMVILNEKVKTIFVPLKPIHTDRDVLLAYFHSVILGFACSDVIMNEEVHESDFKSDSIFHNLIFKVGREQLWDKITRIKNSSVISDIMGELMANRTSVQRCKESLIKTGVIGDVNNLPYNNIIVVEEITKEKFDLFLTALQEKGWIVDRHNLPVEEWRGTWGSELFSKEV